ncbi:hypothetical protein Tco_1272436 [Tanacetum coccineum]
MEHMTSLCVYGWSNYAIEGRRKGRIGGKSKRLKIELEDSPFAMMDDDDYTIANHTNCIFNATYDSTSSDAVLKMRHRLFNASPPDAEIVA